MTFILRPYQIAAKQAILEKLLTHRSTLLEMATGLGKAQPVDSLILTPSGWTPMGLLALGEMVIGSDGRGHAVTGIFPQGSLDVFRVIFSDGSSTRCCAEHLWSVQSKSQKHRETGYTTMQVGDLYGNLEDGGGASKWFIPVVRPVQFDPCEVPIDPYVLGVLIGDGGLKYRVMFSSADSFIVEQMAARIPGVTIQHLEAFDYAVRSGDRGEFGCKGAPFTRALRQLGLFGHGAESKFIPRVYLFNDVETRLSLLRGLMDTDGHVRKDGHAEFSTVSWKLAQDVCELVRSLGGCTRVRSKAPGKYTHHGERRIGRASFRVTVTLNGINPFMLPRKADVAKLDKNQGQTKAITRIERWGRTACQCISVDAPDSLYVTDDYILTHNTVLFGHIAHEWPGRVLVIAHRDELIRQAAEKICAITGVRPAIEMGNERAEDELYGTKVTVASIQTLARAGRRSRFHPDHFSLMVVDEGHHAAAITYREVLAHFTSAKQLFVTATPKRGDEVAMESVCESVAYSYGIEPAIEDGWLVPVRQTVVKIEGLDFSKARTVAKDFNAGDLERILTEEAPLHGMISSAYELIGKAQALWFCVSVAHAKAAANVLGRYAGRESVAFLSGDTPKDERKQIVKAYKDGKIQHLLNCALFLEGFDAPTTSAIVMGRPTKSLSLYMQVLGRGTRPLEGIVDHEHLDTPAARREAIAMSAKPWMNVIDYAGNAGKHKIIQAADVLGGKYEPKERDYAKETIEQEGRSSVDLELALERAKLELELIDEQQKKRQAITAKANYTTQDVNPFVRQYVGKNGSNGKPAAEPCSDRHAGYLCYVARLAKEPWTFTAAKQLSTKQASGVIAKLKAKAGIK